MRDRRDIGIDGGTELLVRGGSTLTEIAGDDVHLQVDRKGFVFVEAPATTMSFPFVVVPDDDDTTEAFTFGQIRTITR